MANKNKIFGILALLLALCLLAGLAAIVFSSGRQIPDNPNRQDPSPLRTETPAGISDNSALQQDKEEEEPEDEPPSPEQTPPEEKEEEATPPETETTVDTGSQTEPSSAEKPADSGDPEPGDTGQNGTGEGAEPSQEPGNGEEEGEKAGLVTDLYSGMIVKTSELENNQLPFYVYYSDPEVDSRIVTRCSHKDNRTHYTTLTPEGVNYTAQLKLGTNYISVAYSDAQGRRLSSIFAITLAADKADENTPTIGEGPPTIETNLDGWEGYIKTQEFTFTVKARTWENKVVYSNHLTVTFDGQVVTNPTGSAAYEYVLYFQRPNVGDIGQHTVTVLAWDDEGNSRFVRYDVEYYALDEGEVIGTVTIVIDATTVGLGIVDEGEYDIIQGEPAAATVKAMLEEYGYEYSAGGSVKVGFYLRSLTRADAFLGAQVPDNLQACIDRDGLDQTAPCTRDTLSEFDFTMGSGWMYCINGALFPGKGLSEYYLNDGDVITLRFTLAYGKDIGGYTSSGGSYGRYSGYCGMWVDGDFIEYAHSWDTENPLRVEPSENEDGYLEYTCTMCGETKREDLPAAEPGSGEVPGQESGGEEPGESGGEEPGESGGEEPGESGGEESGESGGEEAGESGNTEPEVPGGTEPEESGSEESGGAESTETVGAEG